jgi:hypothetical protein
MQDIWLRFLSRKANEMSEESIVQAGSNLHFTFGCKTLVLYFYFTSEIFSLLF